jgi:uncharacterized membrane protein YfbV (UPF0208 family)
MRAVTPLSSSLFLASFNRFLARSVFAKRVSVLKKAIEIVSRPHHFTDKHIKDGMPNASFESVKFYLKLFALTFTILAISDQFRFSEEISEVRYLLVRLIPQLAFGILVLFLLLRVTRNRIPFDGLLQAVLYVDAVYLLFDALLTIPTWYLNYVLHAPAGGREVDLFVTEFEKCLSTTSLPFWLIRGDVQFFMRDDNWQGWIQAVIEHKRYIVAIPFLILFALMVRAKYGSNFLVATIAAGIAFVSANEGFDWIDSKARTALANTTNCESTYVRTLLDKYSADRIAKQLQFKLNNSLKQTFPNVNQTFWLEGSDYIVGFKADTAQSLNYMDHTVGLKLRLQNAAQSSDPAFQQRLFWLFFRSTYCSSHPYWIAVREIRYNLAAFVFHQDRAIVSLKLKPEDCRA